MIPPCLCLSLSLFRSSFICQISIERRKHHGDHLDLSFLVQVFKSIADVHFYIVGSMYENELILSSVLTALHDAIALLLRFSSSPCAFLLLSIFNS